MVLEMQNFETLKLKLYKVTLGVTRKLKDKISLQQKLKPFMLRDEETKETIFPISFKYNACVKGCSTIPPAPLTQMT